MNYSLDGIIKAISAFIDSLLELWRGRARQEGAVEHAKSSEAEAVRQETVAAKAADAAETAAIDIRDFRQEVSTDLQFYSVVDGIGAIVGWSEGTIFENTGPPKYVRPGQCRVAPSRTTYIFWRRGATELTHMSGEGADPYLFDPDVVLIAQHGALTGLVVYYGSRIGGDRAK